jgi:pyruvate dehydrogenase E2 component (dihydrolipoamide acetyltransferase)
MKMEKNATAIEIKVPDIGDFKEVEVIELLVKVGDVIKPEQSLITVESDKASMEIPSAVGGVIQSLSVKLGDKISEGTVLGLIVPESASAQPSASSPATAAASAPSPVAQAPVVAVPAAVVSATPALAVPAAPSRAISTVIPDDHIVKAHASPSVRKFARELGVDLTLVRGSGPKMRIVHADVQAYIKSAVAQVVSGAVASVAAAPVNGSGAGLNLLPWPKVDFSKFGPTEPVALSRIKKLSGPNLHRNWVMIPHVTQFDEADITELESFRKQANELYAKQGVKFTMLAFVIKACVSVLKRLPAFNGSLDEAGENLIQKKYWNIGFAADTPQGLVVPVVKNADQKGVAQIATELAELSAAARDGKLKGSDMQGATFTISSLGGVGGTAFTPIINAPEVAILGLSKSQMKPVWDGKQFVPRLMLPMSLSYDHRVIDGAMAARFTTELAGVLADMRKTLL